MIPKQTEAEILRLFHAEKWRLNTIAKQLHVHHSVVRRVLLDNGLRPERLNVRKTLADPYLPFMLETLAKYPTLTAARLYEMVRQRGYPGSPNHFRAVVAIHRPKPRAEAYLRLQTLPGEQAQVDWAHFGKIRVGNADRRLLAFVMVLSHSRRIFLRFYLGDAMPNFLRGHVSAFQFFEGVPRTLLYDNLKSAVLERYEDAIRFHPTLLELAAHYRYAPKPVAVARGNEKGRVERAIRYIRHAFFAARQWKDLDDLNAQALDWCLGAASDRSCPEERAMTVKEVYEREKPTLLALPENPFPTEEREVVRIGKTPYARFDLNDYSVPHDHVRRSVTVAADLDVVRVLDGPTVIATHRRSFSKGEQIEDPAHIQGLVDWKREARHHRGQNRLRYAAPTSQLFLEAVAEQRGNLGGAVSGLSSLLDLYGPVALEAALQEVMGAGTWHLSAVRQVLERLRRDRGQRPPIPIALPDDPKVRDLVVLPHELSSYDALHGEK